MKIAFLMGRLAKYDAIGNFTFDVMKELSKYHILSLYAFAIDRQISFVTCKFITRKHDHNFLEEFKAIINPVNLAKDLSKNDVIIAIAPQANDILSIPLISKLVNPKLMLILDFHGVTPPIYHKSLRRKFIEYYRILTVKLLGKISDFIIVHSNFLKKELIQNFDLNSNVLPIGVDNRKFSCNDNSFAIKKKLRLEDTFNLLYVGRLVPHKRVDLLIDALAELKDDTVRLLIVGNGPERETLEKKVNTLSLKGRILFLGAVPDSDLPFYYSVCDTFITGSLHEGVCIPILEAFSCGKPVVLPDNTAMSETANGGGLFYNEKSVKSLIGKINMLRVNPNLHKELGEKGLKIANQRNNKKCAVKYRLFVESTHKYSFKKNIIKCRH